MCFRCLLSKSQLMDHLVKNCVSGGSEVKMEDKFLIAWAYVLLEIAVLTECIQNMI